MSPTWPPAGLDEGLCQTWPESANLSLGGETVVLQLGGGEEDAGGSHRPVTALTALGGRGHAPHPAGELFTFKPELQLKTRLLNLAPLIN